MTHTSTSETRLLEKVAYVASRRGQKKSILIYQMTISLVLTKRCEGQRVTAPVLSTCPLHTNSGCGKERRILLGLYHVNFPRQHPFGTILEVYWPCAGGLLAVNAIGTQWRDPINSGLTRWRIAGRHRGNREESRK